MKWHKFNGLTQFFEEKIRHIYSECPHICDVDNKIWFDAQFPSLLIFNMRLFCISFNHLNQSEHAVVEYYYYKYVLRFEFRPCGIIGLNYCNKNNSSRSLRPYFLRHGQTNISIIKVKKSPMEQLNSLFISKKLNR